MKIVQATTNVDFIECTNPQKNKWRIRWNFIDKEDCITYWEEEFNHQPSWHEIRDTIFNWINNTVECKICEGFTWKGMPIWLSSENQFNYKAAYDLALQTSGESLPVLFKFGTDDQPQYYEFQTMEDFTDFYKKAIRHIQDTLTWGWQEKERINPKDYQI